MISLEAPADSMKTNNQELQHRMRERHVTLIWLRLEGVFVFILSILLYAHSGCFLVAFRRACSRARSVDGWLLGRCAHRRNSSITWRTAM